MEKAKFKRFELQQTAVQSTRSTTRRRHFVSFNKDLASEKDIILVVKGVDEEVLTVTKTPVQIYTNTFRRSEILQQILQQASPRSTKRSKQQYSVRTDLHRQGSGSKRYVKALCPLCQRQPWELIEGAVF